MRLEYARRRAVLVQTLAWPVLGDTAGLHVVLELPASHPAELLVAAAAARGIALHAVDRYYAGPPSLNALIIGYGATPVPKIRRAAADLRAMLPREHQAGGPEAGSA
jgi:GntR family transcriptional regulator/MocR family aminotransferase